MAAAVHAPRASPPRLQPLHPVMASPSSLTMADPPSLPSNPMDRKHYLPLSFPDGQFPSFPFQSLPPLPLPPPPPSLPAAPYEEEEIDEDVDEDDMSDLEEELQQELLAYRSRQLEPDMTRQLLSFADRVSADIHKVFGRRKGEEDSCDVYEDKWTITKSGRELYYADLLKIAQGDFGDSKPSSSKATETSQHNKILEDNRHSFSGKADLSLGLGPLNELFEQGLQTGRPKKNPSHQSAGKRLRTDPETSSSKAVPMHKRSFPESFWQEPGMTPHAAGSSGLDLPVSCTSGMVCSLGSNKLPDFSDLMDSWHGDQTQLLQQQQHQQLHTLQPMHHLQQLHQHRDSVLDATNVTPDAARKRRL